MLLRSHLGFGLIAIAVGVATVHGQDLIPHAQDRAPNPPKSPSEAIAAMTVPDGFLVELVAGEPDLVNPVSMTIDEKGRFWVTESLEYPRREPGPGRDRVKVLEDTDGDGKADTFSIFLEGLNIPSGIAVGHGGVWVANSPDILFVPDANRDAVPDGAPVVVATGFGRDDTHELPNSLTWGPDGWLYGWNGVFNPSKVKSNNGKTYEFTCAIWRIHPRTREFQIFCEGTSNPWGIAVNDDGEFFASACVIDHLWHLAEGAYYVRQGGPYPPYTYPLGSIVDHKHQKAAYCGIHWFDSDAYPEQYRKKLYMGNIHGNCINVDRLERNGSTYKGIECPDFLAANDAWFMPVVQKTGPDGCLYILDWYDRYHCYQDANRDPEGIDRLKGRLYRVRYANTPRRFGFDLGTENDQGLIARLESGNGFDRELATRLLTERLSTRPLDDPTRVLLRDRLLEWKPAAANERLESERAFRSYLWILTGSEPFDVSLHANLLAHPSDLVRAWAVRSIRNSYGTDQLKVAGDRDALKDGLYALQKDRAAIVRRELVTLASKGHPDTMPARFWLDVAASNAADPLISHLAWQGLRSRLEDPEAVGELASDLKTSSDQDALGANSLLERVLDRAIGNEKVSGEDLGRLLIGCLSDDHARSSQNRLRLDALTRAIRQGRLKGERLQALRVALADHVKRKLADGTDPVQVDYVELAGAWGDIEALERLRKTLSDREAHPAARYEALEILVSRQDDGVVDAVGRLLADPETPTQLREGVFAPLGPLENPRLADVLIEVYPRLDTPLRQRVLALLSERGTWGRSLVKAVEQKRVAQADLNLNHLRKLLATKDPEIARSVRELWGAIREGRNEKRDLVVGQMRNFLQKTPGDPQRGKAAFTKICAQCHKIHGEGQEVGPDITLNGRNDFEQLISNVFDPNLVIGQGYQAVTVAAKDGRVLSGLLVEDNPARVVLKLQGGQVATLPRAEIDELKLTTISLMPEDVENQLTAQEIADLFAFLALDKPPEDPTAKKLPGAP